MPTRVTVDVLVVDFTCAIGHTYNVLALHPVMRADGNASGGFAAEAFTCHCGRHADATGQLYVEKRRLVGHAARLHQLTRAEVPA